MKEFRPFLNLSKSSLGLIVGDDCIDSFGKLAVLSVLIIFSNESNFSIATFLLIPNIGNKKLYIGLFKYSLTLPKKFGSTFAFASASVGLLTEFKISFAFSIDWVKLFSCVGFNFKFFVNRFAI